MNQILKIAELFTAVVNREIGKLEKDGLVSIHCGYDDVIQIHVTEQYFSQHFSQYEAKEHDMPAHGNVRVSFETDSGNEIFCLRATEFKRVS